MPRKAKEKIDENEIIDKKKESKNKKSIAVEEPEKKASIKKTRTKKTDSKEDKTTTKKSSSKKVATEIDETKSSAKKSSSKKVASKVNETKPTTKKSSSKKAASEVIETKPSAKKSSSKKIVSEVNETKPSTKKVVSEVDETKSSTKKSSSKKIAAEKDTTKSSTKKTATKKATKSSTKKEKTTKSSSTKKVKKEIEEPPINIIEYYDLPYKYGNTLVKLLAQTPKTLFVYWEVSDEDINNFKKLYGDDFFLKTKPVLIIHNLTLNKTYETEINDFANCWYLNTEDSDCKFDIEIGRRLINPSNDFNTTNNITIPNYLHIATSNDIQSPNDHILFEKIKEFVIFRDVSNNNTIKKNIKSFKFLKDIYKFYKEMYDEDILTNNPSSNSSNFNF